MAVDFQIKPITKSASTEHEVLRFFQDCTPYFKMEQDKAPDMDTVRTFFEDCPPSHSREDKLNLAVYQEDEIIAVIDILKDYAVVNEWMIGLFIFHPSKRGQGLAQPIHQTIVELAKEEGVKSLRVGVVTQNDRGQAFWFGLGYTEVKRTEPIQFGNRKNIVMIVQLKI